MDMTEPTSTPPDTEARSPGPARATQQRAGFPGWLRKGVLLGAAALVLALPPVLYFKRHPFDVAHPAAHGQSPNAPSAPHVASRANLHGEPASADVKRMADWVADSRDNGKNYFVIVDKKEAKVFLFDPTGQLQAATPALLGSAHGDDSFPGIGDKPLAQVKPEEKTTPAGRFIAEVGESSSRGEDVVWVDYDAAVSMHRVIKVPQRLKSLASPEVEDNRMSFGCINLPDAFYEKALRPAADRGAVIYVLPETRSLQRTFTAFYDVDSGSRQSIAER